METNSTTHARGVDNLKPNKNAYNVTIENTPNFDPIRDI